MTLLCSLVARNLSTKVVKMVSAFVQRQLVNGDMLKNHKNGQVSIMLCVDQPGGNMFSGRSTDCHSIQVQANESMDIRPGTWVEVIGQPLNNSTIRAEEIIPFNEDNVSFDEDAYNMTVTFLNNIKDFYRFG